MPRFSLKDILRGTTLTALGCGLLAIAFHGAHEAAPNETSLSQAFLTAFGGMLIGYGLAFPFKYPPHQMIFALIGMFAAQAWQSGSSIGLIVFIGLTATTSIATLVLNLRVKKDRLK